MRIRVYLPSVAEVAEPRGDVVLGTLCGPVDSRRIATATVAAEEVLAILTVTAHLAPTIPIGIVHVAGVAVAIVPARRCGAVRETSACLPQPMPGAASPPTSHHRFTSKG